MESVIKKISNILSIIVVFCVSAVFYFNYKGFAYEDGKIVLKSQIAEAAEMNGIATVLPANMAINVSAKYARGSAAAPLTMYEFSSLDCPHCADFHLDIEPKLVEEYVDTGLLRIIFVNFPLDSNAMKAAMLSECMTYENYFGFIDKLFDTQRSWWMEKDNDLLFRYAAEYGVSYDEALSCIHNNTVAEEIISSRQDAIMRLKMKGTPAFLFSGADGNEIIYGVVKYGKLKEYLDNRLAGLQ
ncbi:MAG: thioredoxin domain-containing protein [Alphaproteobacteria bacterium]|nr:thioredoxin domain-containing protein [Alphaproteobacteria bacterium]